MLDSIGRELKPRKERCVYGWWSNTSKLDSSLLSTSHFFCYYLWIKTMSTIAVATNNSLAILRDLSANRGSWSARRGAEDRPTFSSLYIESWHLSDCLHHGPVPKFVPWILTRRSSFINLLFFFHHFLPPIPFCAQIRQLFYCFIVYWFI